MNTTLINRTAVKKAALDASQKGDEWLSQLPQAMRDEVEHIKIFEV